MRVEFLFPKFTHVADIGILPPANTIVHSKMIGHDDHDGFFAVDGAPLLVFGEDEPPHYVVTLKRMDPQP